MVLDLKPAGQDEDTAVCQLMEESLFLGRAPTFASDGVADEDGFAAVDRLDGESILVGDGQATAARSRAAGVNELPDWLETGLLHTAG